MCTKGYTDDYIEPTGHSYETTDVREATCTKEGYIKHKCSKCGKYEYEYTPKAEHKYTDKVVPPSSKEKRIHITYMYSV